MIEYDELVGKAFASCFVNNGVIQFIQPLSQEQLVYVYKRFSKDLLNYNIPHWKVIGFYFGWDDKHQKTAFLDNNHYDKSLIEIGMAMGDLIPACNGGIDPERGCWYGEMENIKNLEFFERGYGGPAKLGVDHRKANVLKVPKEVIGSMTCNNAVPPEGNDNTIVSTDTIYYTQFSAVEEADYPDFLIPNVFVCNIRSLELFQPTMFMFIKRGTGTLDYNDAQKFFVDWQERIMPCRTIYDLSKYISCAYPTGAQNYLNLVYTRDVNEMVLQTILNEYGRELIPNEC